MMVNKYGFVGYTRCSSEEQKKGTSHDYQKNGILRSSRIDGMDCFAWFSDTMTGTTTKREGLNAAFVFLQKLKKQSNYKKLYLIAYKTDRFGRNVEECFGTIRKFKEIGIEVNFTEEWSDYMDDNTPTLLAIRFGMAESESNKIGSRTRDGQRQMLKNGDYPYYVPFGYKRIATGQFKKNKPCKKIVKDEEVKDDLQAMFTDYLSSQYTKTDLIKKYAQFKIKASQFYRLFENPFYASLFPDKYGEQMDYVKLNTPQYITPAEFEQIQKINAANNNGTKGKTWELNVIEEEEKCYLKGVLKCLNTGTTMTSTRVKKHNGNVYEYYQTARAETKQVIPVAFAHTIVESMMNEFEMDLEIYTSFEKSAKKLLNEKLKELKTELQKTTKELDVVQSRIFNIANQFADCAIDADTFNQLNNRFKSQQNALSAKKAELEMQLEEKESPALQALKFMRSVGVVYKAANSKRKNQILKSLFPSGFKINIAKKVVQTNIINIFVGQFIDNARSYTFLKIENEGNDSVIRIEGRPSEKVQTEIIEHRQLIMSLVA